MRGQRGQQWTTKLREKSEFKMIVMLRAGQGNLDPDSSCCSAIKSLCDL